MADSRAPMVTATPAVDEAAQQTSSFLDALFGYAPEDLHALLWTLPDKRSTWVALDDGPAPVATQVRRLADNGKDVYVAVSAAKQAGTMRTRITSDNSAGIMGLWADVDIADGVHKKSDRLPPDEPSAIALLKAAALEPTLIVHSGHGLQAWWLFHEFWAFDTEQDRRQAAALAQRWNDTLRVKAAQQHWVVDSTFDLARVMRVPGTLNRKGDPVMPVRLIRTSGPQYSPDDIEPYCIDPELAPRPAARDYTPDNLDLTAGALRLDHDLWQALYDNDEKFASTWDYKRPDLPDQSPSSYDLSLADKAARAGWDDQAIAGLLYQFRRRHKREPEKALRADYIAGTIAKVRSGNVLEVDPNEVIDAARDVDDAVMAGDPDAERGARRSALEVLSKQLGFAIVQIIQHTSDPERYILVTPTDRINLGGISNLTSNLKFRNTVLNKTRHLVPLMKQGDWDRIVRLMAKIWEQVDVGVEATTTGEMQSWIDRYLEARPPVDDVNEAANADYPFIDPKTKQTCIIGSALTKWIQIEAQYRITGPEFGTRMRELGWLPGPVSYLKPSNIRSTRNVWKSPKED